MTRREEILAIIRANVAKQGYTSNHDFRLYCENRISYPSFKKAVREGMAAHAAAKSKATIATAALAILLASPAHAATPTFELPIHPTDAYLAGCAIMVHDDGTRLATCDEDGAVLVWDGDGQRFVNEAGAPIRAAGWYVLE